MEGQKLVPTPFLPRTRVDKSQVSEHVCVRCLDMHYMCVVCVYVWSVCVCGVGGSIRMVCGVCVSALCAMDVVWRCGCVSMPLRSE